MITLVIISFFLDAILFSSLNQDTLLCPLFTLLSLLIIYPFLSEERNKFLLISGVLGIFYDICYANTLFLNVFLFVGISYFIMKVMKRLSISILNTYLIGISIIGLYRTIHCLFFVVLGFSRWSFTLLIQSILSSIILNSIYLIIFYFVAKKIRLKLRNRKYKLLKVKKSE